MFKCLIDTVFYSLTFEAGKVYDIDEMLAARLLRNGHIEPYTAKEVPEEVEPEVEQPEALGALKPVATLAPLPETDDLAKPLRKVVKPKPKRK